MLGQGSLGMELEADLPEIDTLLVAVGGGLIGGICARDGIVSRIQLVAEIRWRIFWARFGYGLLLFVSVIAAVAAVIAAAEGWK